MKAVSIESPCNDVCKLDERTGWCLGCYRTLAEIGAWTSMDDGGKRAVLEQAATRREVARGQRAAARGNQA